MTTGINTADVAALFTEVLIKRIYHQLYEDFPTLELMEKTSEDIEIGEPSYARVPLIVGLNPSVGAKPFQGKIQKGGVGKSTTAKIRLANMYGTILAPGKLIRNSSAKSAFASHMTIQTDLTMIALKQDVNRQIHGDGRGILATAAAGVTSATLPVDSTIEFAVGMIVDVIERDSGTAATNGIEREIVSVNPGVSITLDASVTTAAGPTVTCVYRDEARNVEMTGFEAGINTGNPTLGALQEVDATVHTSWNPVVFDASTLGFGGQASEAVYQHVASRMDEQGGHGSNRKLLICPYEVRDRFITRLKGDQRFLNPLVLKSGFKTVEWNGNPFSPDKRTAANTLLKVDPMFTKIWQYGEFDFMDEDGGKLRAHPSIIDMFMATIFNYLNVGYMKRVANARINNLTA